MLVHPPHLMLSSATLSNEILIKNLVIFVGATTAESISFLNHRNRKVVGGKHNVILLYADVSTPPIHLVLSSASPSYEIFCCSFLIKILHNSKMNFKPYPYLCPYLPVGVCCIETPTNHLRTTFVKINNSACICYCHFYILR